MVMKCLEETDSQTVFTGVLRLSSNTDISKLANMPLYLIDSSEVKREKNSLSIFLFWFPTKVQTYIEFFLYSIQVIVSSEFNTIKVKYIYQNESKDRIKRSKQRIS